MSFFSNILNFCSCKGGNIEKEEFLQEEPETNSNKINSSKVVTSHCSKKMNTIQNISNFCIVESSNCKNNEFDNSNRVNQIKKITISQIIDHKMVLYKNCINKQ